VKLGEIFVLSLSLLKYCTAEWYSSVVSCLKSGTVLILDLRAVLDVEETRTALVRSLCKRHSRKGFSLFVHNVTYFQHVQYVVSYVL
jgi:hypothetical protein